MAALKTTTTADLQENHFTNIVSLAKHLANMHGTIPYSSENVIVLLQSDHYLLKITSLFSNLSEAINILSVFSSDQ